MDFDQGCWWIEFADIWFVTRDCSIIQDIIEGNIFLIINNVNRDQKCKILYTEEFVSKNFSQKNNKTMYTIKEQK